MELTKERILEAMSHVYDPEIPVDIVNLGLVYEVAIDAGRVDVKMTTTAPGCPVGDYLAALVEQTLGKIEGVKAVRVEFVWDPPWRPEMMSAEAKRTLGWS